MLDCEEQSKFKEDTCSNVQSSIAVLYGSDNIDKQLSASGVNAASGTISRLEHIIQAVSPVSG